MRARYYDPTLGRFISEDPAKDGINWYAYCANNPVNAVDPDGRFMLLDLLLGTNEGSIADDVEAAQAKLVENKIKHKIGDILAKYADRYAKCLWDETFKFTRYKDYPTGGFRLDIVGSEGRTIAIDFTNKVAPHINSYGYGAPHSVDLLELLFL